MVRRKEAKTATLFMVAVVLIMRLAEIPAESVGLYPGAPFHCRLTYHFFHANILHALLNCWCLLSVMFTYDLSIIALLSAFAIAMSFPVNAMSAFLPDMPTVGLSGICFALLGRIAFSVSRKVYYQSWVCVFLAIGFIFPGTNAWLHLYCYLCGLVLAFLNKPAR